MNTPICIHDYRCIHRHLTSDLKCTICGKIISHEEYNKTFSTIKLDVPKLESSSMEMPKFASTGWICPVCGAGNSPMNSTCPCKKPSLWWSNDNTQTVRYKTSSTFPNNNNSVGIVGGDLG